MHAIFRMSSVWILKKVPSPKSLLSDFDFLKYRAGIKKHHLWWRIQSSRHRRPPRDRPAAARSRGPRSSRPRSAARSRTPSPREALGPSARRGDATADRQNFGKLLLVFGCIGTDLCKKIRVFQHFSKSTRLSS